MIAPFAHRKIAFLAAALLASGAASALIFSGAGPQIRNKAANVLSIMHERSPGVRPAGAMSYKHRRLKAVVAAAPAPRRRVSRVLATVVPAAPPIEAAPPIAGAAVPIPAALPPMAPPVMIVPAAAVVRNSFFVLPLVYIHHGGDRKITITPPSRPHGPPPVPGVPEPSTWAMMILGFLFIGGLLRRRRRQEESLSAPGDAVPAAQ